MIYIACAIVFWERTLDYVFDSFYDVQKGRKIILKRESGLTFGLKYCEYVYSPNDFALRKFVPVAYFVRIHKTRSALRRYSNFSDTQNLWVPRYSGRENSKYARRRAAAPAYPIVFLRLSWRSVVIVFRKANILTTRGTALTIRERRRRRRRRRDLGDVNVSVIRPKTFR